ncbi:hypothetical protein [Cryobacterium sinapicolor]|nr:hypothetical protein [Cryobacterium sinapicolor]
MAALLSLSTQWDQSGVPLAPESVIGWVAVSGVVGALLLERRDA